MAEKKTVKPQNNKNQTANRKMSDEEIARREKRISAASWIMVASSIILFICMVLDWVSISPLIGAGDVQNASRHILGIGGFWIFQALYGVFGFALVVFPILLFALGLNWKEICHSRTNVSQIVSGSLFMLFGNTMAHVIVSWSELSENRFTAVKDLFMNAHTFRSGGIIGGLSGFGLKYIVNYAGVLIICIFGMLISGVVFFSIDPSKLVDKLKKAIQLRVERYKSDRAQKSAESKADKERKRAEEREAKRLEREEREQKKLEEKQRREEEKKSAEEEAENEPDENNDTYPEKDADESEEHIIIPEIIKEAKKARETDEKTELSDDEAAERVFPADSESRTRRNENDEAYEQEVSSVFGSDMLGDTDNEQTADGDEQEDASEQNNAGDVIVPDSQSDLPPEEEKYVYVPPRTDMLSLGSSEYCANETEVAQKIEILKQTFTDFCINVKDISCTCGPTVTRYEVKPEAGTRVRQITNLQEDIGLNLSADVRIEPILGKNAVGIEVPNTAPKAVKLRNVLEMPEFTEHKSPLAVALGLDVSGKPVICDLEKMPHLLIAGTTGSGKSVCINSIIMSIIYHSTPDDVKMILVDPKTVEFTNYRDIPFLSLPIVTEPKRAAGALQAAVREMEHRFQMIADVGARDIKGYNEITKNDPERKHLPRIVIIIDELADLMMTARQEVETAICRIAQKARAAGMHLVIGTQRPSVDVITGLIKANVPSRIAFTVVSYVDSKTILDVAGAEKLCGRGDMLYSPVGSPKPMRVQGTFVSDGEIEDIVTFVKENNTHVVYDEEFANQTDENAARCGNSGEGGSGNSDGGEPSGDGEDPKLNDAIALAIETGKISTSLMQRKLEVGYGRAAKLIDRMEELGFVSAPEGNKPRRILITAEQFEELRMNK